MYPYYPKLRLTTLLRDEQRPISYLQSIRVSKDLCCSFSWNAFFSLVFLTFHADCYTSENRLTLPVLSPCPCEADRPHQISPARGSLVQTNLFLFSVLYKIRISHILLVPQQNQII